MGGTVYWGPGAIPEEQAQSHCVLHELGREAQRRVAGAGG